MAEELVVGSNGTPDASGLANYLYCGKFQAVASATGVTKFFLRTMAGTGNVKVAVYADNAGVPASSPLGYNDSGQAVLASQWNELSVSSHNIVSGNWYWLCAVADAGNLLGRVASGGASKYLAETYSSWTWGDISGLSYSDGSHLFSYYLLGETGVTTYTVTYDGNGNTGGTAPTDDNSPYAANAAVTVLSNSGSLVKTGSYFAGWNTAANGSGTSYQYLDRFNMPVANTILYAQWKINIPIYPAKTIVAGGQGTRADASDNNGGCFSSDSDYASFQDTNGGPLYTVTECAYDTDTGKITKAGEFATGLEGVWVNTREGAAGAWVEKRYWIQASDANSITIGAGLGSNADIDVWVGGALKTLEEQLVEAAEASGGYDSGYNAEFDIHYGASIIRIDYPDGILELSNGDSVTLDVPAGSGGAGSLINGGLINAI